MSWRFLFLFLVLAAASAVFGGIELGDWLIEHAPESIAQASANAKSDRDVVLDANGKPFRAQPPQPRIDGTLGVPREMAPVEWTIAAVTAMQIEPEANATQVGTDEPQELPTAGVGLSTAANDISTVDVSGARSTASIPAPVTAPPASGKPPAPAPVAPRDRAPPSAAAAAAANIPGWQQSLRREIEICNNLGFFQRPTCVQNARNKICTPNDGWGKVPECPPRTYDRPGA